MKSKVCVLIAAALIAWGMKRYYADAQADDLWWILDPTARLVGAATGTAFVMQPGEGYLSRERLFLIEKSCAGINFMIAAFGMLVFTLFHRVRSGTTAAQVLGVSLLASYSTAVLVNALRITIATWLAAHPVALWRFSAADVHRLEGIIVYFGGLVLLYRLVRWIDGRMNRFEWTRGADAGRTMVSRTALPLAAYYTVTLAVPLANGAAVSAAFVDHALFVLAVPPIVIVLWWVVRKIVRWPRKSGSRVPLAAARARM